MKDTISPAVIQLLAGSDSELEIREKIDRLDDGELIQLLRISRSVTILESAIEATVKRGFADALETLASLAERDPGISRLAMAACQTIETGGSTAVMAAMNAIALHVSYYTEGDAPAEALRIVGSHGSESQLRQLCDWAMETHSSDDVGRQKCFRSLVDALMLRRTEETVGLLLEVMERIMDQYGTVMNYIDIHNLRYCADILAKCGCRGHVERACALMGELPDVCVQQNLAKGIVKAQEMAAKGVGNGDSETNDDTDDGFRVAFIK